MKQKFRFVGIGLGMCVAVSLIAGGFALQIGKPSENPEARAKDAVLVVRTYACAEPEKTSVAATAEGIMSGRHETVTLKLIELSEKGTYALTRQWPSEGKWVVTLVATNARFGFHPSAIVSVQGDSFDWARAKRLSQPPSRQDIEAALNTTAVAAELETK